MYRVEHYNNLGHKVGELKDVKHYFAAKNHADNVTLKCRENPACSIRDIFIINEESGATIRRTV